MKVVHDNPTANISRASLTLDSGQKTELYIEANVPLDTKADCWLFLLLPVCMQLGENLEIDGLLTESAASCFNVAKKELLRGHSKMKDIKLIANRPFVEAKIEASDKRGVGLFYSGGVDSTYASETLSDVDTLVSVWGFDIPTKNQKHWDLTLELLNPYAKDLGRKLILVKTNIRELSNGLLEWGGDYHGTAIAGVANALSNQLKHVYAAAGFIRTDPNWGHSPILYNAYSTNYQKVQETEPVLRIAKAAGLGENPRTASIRACYRNITGLANCGLCKKCVRTRLEFDLVGAKYRPLGLEVKPKASEILKNKLTNWDILFYKEAFDWSKENGLRVSLSDVLIVYLARFKSIFQIRNEKLRDRLGIPKNKRKKKPKSRPLS